MLKLSWIAAVASLGISETQSLSVCLYAIWIVLITSAGNMDHDEARRKECRRQAPRFLLLREVGFDYLNFLAVTRLAIEEHPAIFSGVVGNVVLRVSEQSRFACKEGSSYMMHQSPSTFFLCGKGSI